MTCGVCCSAQQGVGKGMRHGAVRRGAAHSPSPEASPRLLVSSVSVGPRLPRGEVVPGLRGVT